MALLLIKSALNIFSLKQLKDLDMTSEQVIFGAKKGPKK